MKKLGGLVLVGLGLAVVLAAPAMATTTGIEVDGKTYVFQGNAGVYREDGKTFVIGENDIRIQEAGKADRVFPMDKTMDDETFVAAGAENTYVESMQDAVIVEDEESAESIEARYEQYRAFGLAYDTARSALCFNGQRVRFFEDDYLVSPGVYATTDYVDELGVVDVAVERDERGSLTGLRVQSGAQFAARNLSDGTGTAQSGVPLSEAEREALYAPYAAFGLTYHAELDQFSYQGQIVRAFQDIKKSNGEALSSGRFEGEMINFINERGTVDVVMIRDYQRPDADGNGALTGIQVEEAK